MPVLVVTGIVGNVSVRLVGDVSLLPRGHLRFHRLHVGAGFELQEHPSRLAAPTGQELRAVCVKRLEIEPQESVDLEARVLRKVLEDADNPEVALQAAGNDGQRFADHLIGAVALDRFFCVSTAVCGALRVVPASSGKLTTFRKSSSANSQFLVETAWPSLMNTGPLSDT